MSPEILDMVAVKAAMVVAEAATATEAVNHREDMAAVKAVTAATLDKEVTEETD
jgi:hypothetical protein